MSPSSRQFSRDRSTAEHFGAYLPGQAIEFDDQHAWRDVYVRILTHRTTTQSVLVPAVAEPLVVWILAGTANVEERVLGGEWKASIVNAGDFFLTTTTAPYEMRWQTIDCDAFQVMHLYLGLPILDAARRDVLGRSTVPLHLREVSGQRDPVLSSLLDRLKTERMATRNASPLFVQGIAQALAVHLVRSYRDPDSTRTPAASALPAFKLRQVTAHMDEHLDAPFDLAVLAGIAGMSEYHFSRLFKRATRLAPSLYFIRLRVQRAREMLAESDLSIIDIGLAVGYSNASHFSQIFRREVGITPSEYRKGGGLLA